jgi:hypothetical protein
MSKLAKKSKAKKSAKAAAKKLAPAAKAVHVGKRDEKAKISLAPLPAPQVIALEPVEDLALPPFLKSKQAIALLAPITTIEASAVEILPPVDSLRPDGTFKVNNLHGGESRMDLTRQWVSRPDDERFLNLDTLHKSTLERFTGSSEATLAMNELRLDVDSGKRLVAKFPGAQRLGLTHWSFGQLCNRAKAPRDFIADLDVDFAAQVMNHRLERLPSDFDGKAFYNDKLHALTGPDYGRIADHVVVDAVRSIAGNGTGDTRWKIPGAMSWQTMIYDPKHPVTKETTTLYASDRDVFMFLVDDQNPIEVGLVNGQPDLMFRGFYVSNSEMGSQSLKVATFYMRSLCCNRIMWGVEDFEEVSIRHTKFAPDRFIADVAPSLKTLADASSKKLISSIKAAKAAIMADDDDDAMAFLVDFGFGKDRSEQILHAVLKEEQRPARSAWDFAQGITAVARDIPHANDRVAFELEAKHLLELALA